MKTASYYINQVDREQGQKLVALGYHLRTVSEQDFEDGIGVAVGVNAIDKSGAWSTVREAFRAEGLEFDYSAYTKAMFPNR